MNEKVVFAPIAEEIKQEIKNFIHHFDSQGKVFIQQERNAIKIKEIDGLTLNVKSFKVPHLINQFVYKYIRKSKARRSFENASILLNNQIGSPKPLAFFEYSNWFGLKKSYYVSEHLEYDLTFRELIHDENYPDRNKILEETAQFTFKLHENNVLFKDHSPGNTLIKKTENGYQFFLVDINRMQFKTLTFEERMKNFARLTDKKEMVEIMSASYAKLINKKPDEVFELMWKFTSAFQERFQRKKKYKKYFLPFK